MNDEEILRHNIGLSASAPGVGQKEYEAAFAALDRLVADRDRLWETLARLDNHAEVSWDRKIGRGTVSAELISHLARPVLFKEEEA